MTWKVGARETERSHGLALRLGVSPVTAHLLVQRGFDDPDAARDFLAPTLAGLHEPDGLPDIDRAAERLARAVAGKEPVLLFGDYDVDGTTGSVVLHEVLTALGGDVRVHIPDRHEGYGLSCERLERAKAEGVAVVVTIDNGIAAVAEAARCRELGMDLVVADHHTIGPTLPAAHALVHPRLEGSRYPNPHLCGAGVAFKVAWATAKRACGGKTTKPLQEVLLRCLAYVALGTVADVVPLVGENRILVRWGLRALRAAGVGPRALLEVAAVEGELDATTVAFRVAPRLNAAGRMGVARRSFELLTTRDAARAKALATELDQENERRKALQERVAKEAEAQVEAVYGPRPLKRPGIVVWHDTWPHGIVGIVAARLAERFGRPALCVGVEGEVAKGSGRTSGGVDLLRALEAAQASTGGLTRFGGHAAAVGFTSPAAALERVRDAFDRGVAASLGLPADTPPHEVAARLEGYEVVADAEVRLDEVSRQLVDELSRMAPFGEGNEEPLFTARRVTLVGEPKLMGKTGEHVSFLVKQGDRVFRTVAFGRKDVARLLEEKARARPGAATPLEVAFRPRLNHWNGGTKLELELEAIRVLEE